MEKNENELKEKIKQLIISHVMPPVPSDFNIYINGTILFILISCVNDKDESKYYKTKAALMKWERALIVLVNAEFNLNIESISY